MMLYSWPLVTGYGISNPSATHESQKYKISDEDAITIVLSKPTRMLHKHIAHIQLISAVNTAVPNTIYLRYVQIPFKELW